MTFPDILESSLLEAGLSAFGFLSGERLAAACRDMPVEARSRCGIDTARGAVVAALAYSDGPVPGARSEPAPWAAGYSGPRARIARFARANWYTELGARLALSAARSRAALLEAGIEPGPKGDWRRFVNSRLPEKRLAVEAGLGRIGRHCLLMLPKAGSAVVIGVLISPLPLPDSASSPRDILDADCENCGACVAACPTGALRGDGSLERERCVQHWSSVPGPLPAAVDAVWGDRLYGCDACQEACPRFRPDASARTERGILGPGLPASWVVSASEGEIRASLRGSALGMGWISISALKRNALHLTEPAQTPTMEENGGPDGNH
jgi:epoxyqueuosine reductase QueG